MSTPVTHRRLFPPNFHEILWAMERALKAGWTLGAVIGFVLVLGSFGFGVLVFLWMIINEGNSSGLPNLSSIVLLLLLGIIYGGVQLVLCVCGAAIVFSLIAATAALVTFAPLAVLIVPNTWELVSRPFHRGLLYGTILGVALLPVAWWLSTKHDPTSGTWVNLAPICLLLATITFGGWFAAVVSIFSIRAGHPDGPYRPLPRPFDSW